ncbi:hypothetical protein BC629DRAFT_1440722 [Irpex lacteus]|nr:hypothetical protein BC629DRAFT_1440722 [Irpex lacteus]
MSTFLTASLSFLQTAPRLPLELIHLILTHLSPSLDKQTLSTCTLVHPSWSTYARRLLFSHVRLDALTMPTRPHEEFTHINMPNFPSFLEFMRDNPILANSLTDLEITGFVRDGWKEMPSAIEGEGEDGEGGEGAGMWGRMELDVYDEFDWEWDWDTHQLADAPTSCRYTKLPLPFLHSILGLSPGPSLFPRLQSLSLNSLFIEFDVQWYSDGGGVSGPMNLESLVLREVGTTANTTRALLHLLNAFNPLHLTLSFLPTSDSPSSLASILTSKRTKALEISNASTLLEIIKLAPSFTANITNLSIHIREACEVTALANLLKTSLGRQLRELSLDLKPACYLSKPEVHIDHQTYLSLTHTLTLFPCPSLRTLSLHLLTSFSYSGSTTALDCTPHLLGTLNRSVEEVRMVVGFPFVVQAAVVNADWSNVVWALVRVCGGATSSTSRAAKRGESERSALPSRSTLPSPLPVPARGGTAGVKRVTLIVQNDGARIGEEERRNVEMLFEEKFWLIRDVLSVEFDP